MQRAKRLLEGLRIHHLGFGFFWTVTFIVLAGFQGAGAIADYWQIYILTEQTLMPLAVGALGTLCAFRRCELPHWTASAASFMLSGAALLYFLAFHFGQGDGVIAAAAGILMGGSCTLFFLLWEMFYVTEGQQRALICIPLSAAMSVGLYLLICLLSPIAVALTAVCVLPFLALLCLQKSLAEIEADATAPLTRPALMRAVGDLWRPVLCACILGFSWKLIAGIEPAQSSGGAAVLVGFAAAALLVVALELFLPKGFDILHICQVLFPARDRGGRAAHEGPHGIGHRRQAVHLGKHHSRPRQKHLQETRHPLPPRTGRSRRPTHAGVTFEMPDRTVLGHNRILTRAASNLSSQSHRRNHPSWCYLPRGKRPSSPARPS